MHRDPRWPLERALFALAGSMTLLSALLAAIYPHRESHAVRRQEVTV